MFSSMQIERPNLMWHTNRSDDLFILDLSPWLIYFNFIDQNYSVETRSLFPFESVKLFICSSYLLAKQDIVPSTRFFLKLSSPVEIQLQTIHNLDSLAEKHLFKLTWIDEFIIAVGIFRHDPSDIFRQKDMGKPSHRIFSDCRNHY